MSPTIIHLYCNTSLVATHCFVATHILLQSTSCYRTPLFQHASFVETCLLLKSSLRYKKPILQCTYVAIHILLQHTCTYSYNTSFALCLWLQHHFHNNLYLATFMFPSMQNHPSIVPHNVDSRGNISMRENSHLQTSLRCVGCIYFSMLRKNSLHSVSYPNRKTP
jgi:hypothetical protein